MLVLLFFSLHSHNRSTSPRRCTSRSPTRPLRVSSNGGGSGSSRSAAAAAAAAVFCCWWWWWWRRQEPEQGREKDIFFFFLRARFDSSCRHSQKHEMPKKRALQWRRGGRQSLVRGEERKDVVRVLYLEKKKMSKKKMPHFYILPTTWYPFLLEKKNIFSQPPSPQRPRRTTARAERPRSLAARQARPPRCAAAFCFFLISSFF